MQWHTISMFTVNLLLTYHTSVHSQFMRWCGILVLAISLCSGISYQYLQSVYAMTNHISVYNQSMQWHTILIVWVDIPYQWLQSVYERHTTLMLSLSGELLYDPLKYQRLQVWGDIPKRKVFIIPSSQSTSYVMLPVLLNLSLYIFYCLNDKAAASSAETWFYATPDINFCQEHIIHLEEPYSPVIYYQISQPFSVYDPSFFFYFKIFCIPPNDCFHIKNNVYVFYCKLWSSEIQCSSLEAPYGFHRETQI